MPASVHRAGTTAGTGVVGWSGNAAGTNTSGGIGVYAWGQPGNGTGRNGVGVRGDSGGSGRPGLIGVLGIADPVATSIGTPAQRRRRLRALQRQRHRRGRPVQ